VLELGGKCPVYVDGECPDLGVVANRLVWGKCLNAGQTCLAPDLVVVDSAVVDSLEPRLVGALDEFFGGDVANSPDFARICTVAQAERLVAIIQEAEKAGAVVVCGGSKMCDAQRKYVAPTVLRCDALLLSAPTAKILTEELFGPVLVLVSAPGAAGAIDLLRAAYPRQSRTPLALYVFTTNSATADRVSAAVPSGAVMRGDVILHFCNPHLPFGGAGTSGSGRCHGRFSFEAFTHFRSFAHKPCLAEFGGLRYPPYDKFGGRSGAIFEQLTLALPDVPVAPRRALALCALAVFAAVILSQGGARRAAPP